VDAEGQVKRVLERVSSTWASPSGTTSAPAPTTSPRPRFASCSNCWTKLQIYGWRGEAGHTTWWILR
jgi:hypothetical protein